MRKIALIALLLVVWELSGVIFISTNRYLPFPHELVLALKEELLGKDIYLHIFASLQRVIIGFLVASTIAVPLGLLSAYFESLGEVIKPVIEVIRPIPPIAYIPIAIILFGLGDLSAYFIVFVGAFFPIFTNTYLGAVSLPKIYKNISRSFEISRRDYLRKVLLPYSMPFIFIGLKIGLGTGWMSVIAAELIGTQSGLGYFIQLNRLLLRIENVFVGMLLIGLVGYLLNKSIGFVENKVITWKN